MINEGYDFWVYDNRLASFQQRALQHEGGSRAPKVVSWPHQKLSTEELAKAGFYFDPSPEDPDNVTCFLCLKSLSGWDEQDHPLQEHLNHVPDCGWAITAAVEAGLGAYAQQNPNSAVMAEARKATFGGRWPYDDKKSYKCKTKQLVEAGWHYTADNESNDFTTCAYCNLALDGWEAGDKPYDEHYKRRPDCEFFALLQKYPPVKKARARAGTTASKASRLSVQSVATIATGVSDLASVADLTADHDDTVLTTASTMTQGGKKAAKGRKAPAKGRKTKAKKDEPVEILEDEPQELEVPAPAPAPAKPGRGRKRVSDAMEDSVVTNAEAPAPKKRATRVRGSNAVDTSIMTTLSQDTEMTDAPAPKKAPAKKRAAKTATKKASQSSLRSQLTEASLRDALLDDDEIERQLQADLERPFSEDEDLVADSDSERIKAKPARGRPKKVAATQKANPQTQAQPSSEYAMFDPTPSEPNDTDISAEYKKMEAEIEAEKEESPEPLVVPKKGRKAGTRKASKQTKKAKAPAPPTDPIDDEDPLGDVTPVPIPAPVRKEEEKPAAEAEVDPDASTGTVVSQPIKRGRGRPSKKSLLSQASLEDEKRRSSGAPVEVEIPLEPVQGRESFTAAEETPAQIPRKPVPPPRESGTTSAPPAPPASTTPPTSSSNLSSTTPARINKSLPPPPPESASRLPRPPGTPKASTTPSANAKQATISPSQSPQSSDAENQPPSSKPSVNTPKRFVLAPVVATPAQGSPSRRNVVGGLQSTEPWTAVDLDTVFSPGESGSDKENGLDRLFRMGGELTTPEKRMTVEEWLYYNSEIAQEKMKHECEIVLSKFESEGMRAIRVLEGIIVD
ncbi:hypothetical protein V8F06_005632 [Rhypophila decipiens]